MTIIGGEPIGNSTCCITSDEVTEYKSVWTDLICATTEEIDSTVCNVVEFINLYTNRDFCPVEECRVFDGTGTNYLRFRDYLNSFTSISYESCTNEIFPTEDPAAYNHYLHFDCCEFTFPKGHKNVTVCGAWGEPLPANVKEAAILMTIEKINPGLTGMTSSVGKVSSVDWSDFNIKYSESKDGANMRTTGYIEIDRLLDMYINTDAQIGFCSTSEFEDDECSCRKPNCDCYWS